MALTYAQPATAPGNAKLRMIGVGALIIAAVANLGFVAAKLLGSTLSSVSSFVSELGAVGQPGAWVLHLCDAVQGISMLIASALLWNAFPKRRLVRTGQVGLILIGVLTAADSMLPLDCVPTADAACRLHEGLALVSFAHQTHGVTGVAVGLTINVVLLTFGLAFRHQPSWRALSVSGYSLGLAYTGLNLLFVAQYYQYLPWLGITQRIQVVLFSAFLIVLAITLAKVSSGLMLSADYVAPRRAKPNEPR